MRQDSLESPETLSPREIAAREKLAELVRILARQAASEQVANATGDDGTLITSNRRDGNER